MRPKLFFIIAPQIIKKVQIIKKGYRAQISIYNYKPHTYVSLFTIPFSISLDEYKDQACVCWYMFSDQDNTQTCVLAFNWVRLFQLI